MTAPSSIRVVFVTPWWGKPRTGPEVYARYLWESFRDDAEIDFHLVAASDEVGGAHPNLHLVRRPSGNLSLYREVARAALDLCRNLPSPGLLHVNNSNFHHSLLRAPWPIIGQINDYESADFRPLNLSQWARNGLRRQLSLWRRHWLERKFVRNQSVTLCNSEYTRDRVIAAYAADPARVRVAYKAVDVGRFVRPADMAPSGSPNGTKTVVFLGTNFHIKGLDILVEAMSRLAVPARLLVIGVQRADFEGRFPGLLGGLPAGVVAEFAGTVPRERVPDLLWSADAYVLPSRMEALGVALLEAVAAGLPCVATRVGGIPEIARLFPSVELVEPHDPDALSLAIARALNRPRESPDLANLARTFGRDAMIADLRRLYHSLS